MSLGTESRRTVRLLGVLIVLSGTIFLLWQTASLFKSRVQYRPKIVALPPSVVQFGDVDPTVLLNQIVVSGHVNDHALGEIEKRGLPSLTAAAEFVAARFEHEHNRDEQALSHIQRALESSPGNAGLHTWCSALMLNSGQLADAVTQSELAAQLQPESADVQRIRGLAYYQAGRREDAIAAWEHSLQLAPNQIVQEYLEKVKREAAVEEHFTETARGHFVLRYEGGQPAEALTDDLLRTLEQDYDNLALDLGVAPKTVTTVVLYSAQQFSDVTQAPSWAGAINDGRMRIPLGDVSSITPQLEALLKHELTHSFVHSAVPNCPVWLNEGLAQLEEPKSLEVLTASLGPGARSGEFVPLSQLEGSFQGMTPEQAQRAYLESLAAAEYLRSAYGMDGLRRLLLQLSDGEQPEAALRTVTMGGYADLDREAEAYWAKRVHSAPGHE